MVASREELAGGYRERRERDAELAAEWAGVSVEATELLGDAPTRA